MDKKEIKKVLDFDALQEAEKLTGESYKNDKGTESLGFGLHILHNQKKREMLEELGDSTFSNELEKYLNIVGGIGFEVVLKEPFTNKDGIVENLFIMWHDEYSILLCFDTHTWGDDGSWAKSGKEVPPPSVNGGKFYYNWMPNPDCNRFDCTSSGGYIGNGDSNKTYGALFNPDSTPHLLPDELRSIEPELDLNNYDEYRKSFDEWCLKVDSYIKSNDLTKIWSGDHDCREAVKFNIEQLAENGTFQKQWKDQPFLWLLNYMDSKDDDYDYEAINAERIAKLPQRVIDAITPK